MSPTDRLKAIQSVSVSMHQFSPGFTLIELLAITAILVIIATIGISNFRPLIENRQLDHLSSSLVNTMALAQTQSQQNGEYTLMCGGTNQSNCTASWATGWSLYQIDHTSSGLKKIYGFENPYANMTVTPSSDEIKFNSQKQLFDSTKETIFICASDKTKGYRVTIDVSGIHKTFLDITSGGLEC